MDIASAKRQVKDTIEAYFATDEAGLPRIDPAQQRPLFLIGAPGIGKTAIMAQIASEMGIGLVSYSMTHHTRQSALGLPFIVERSYKGFGYSASEYTMSEIIASIYDYMNETGLDRGILFLDEVNCVSETLYPSMLQFLQFKTFGRHHVPENWVVVCAGNPPEYNKSVHEFDIVTLDRLRKIEIEPDYDAWRAYALGKGLHPAILSFLEVKRDFFYSVETTPTGKSFVTARGWDDLSQTISLHEESGKPVDVDLIGQFLQDPEVAERFAVYYRLFEKYRSDYQVESILAGTSGEPIAQRADAAAFDERLALLGLMLDAIAGRAAKALEAKGVLASVRGFLADKRAAVEAGGNLTELIAAEVSSREERLARSIDAGTASTAAIRERRLAMALLKELSSACEVAQTVAGSAAFETARALFGQHVAALEESAAATCSAIDNAFAFNDYVFGQESRENLVFVTELTARRSTSSFISEFGSESYYAHNDDLLVDARRNDILDRIDKLGF